MNVKHDGLDELSKYLENMIRNTQRVQASLESHADPSDDEDTVSAIQAELDLDSQMLPAVPLMPKEEAQEIVDAEKEGDDILWLTFFVESLSDMITER